MKFPVDAPRGRVVKTLQALGFEIVREREHISMRRANPDGTTTPLTLPNHNTLKSSTLRAICTQARIPRDEFLRAFERSRSGAKDRIGNGEVFGVSSKSDLPEDERGKSFPKDDGPKERHPPLKPSAFAELQSCCDRVGKERGLDEAQLSDLLESDE
jgi:predicted RNA binding protein YcfA (HicA-like mRNA interferase family)